MLRTSALRMVPLVVTVRVFFIGAGYCALRVTLPPFLPVNARCAINHPVGTLVLTLGRR